MYMMEETLTNYKKKSTITIYISVVGLESRKSAAKWRVQTRETCQEVISSP